MILTEREWELGQLAARADETRDGRGGVVIVCGESGAGKTTFVEAFLQRWPETERVQWAACDPLSTPRPLGPIHDLADNFAPSTQEELRRGEHPYQIFAAVFEELKAHPTLLVIDDLHWADQATVDLLRLVLRRIRQTNSLVIGIVRDDEIPPTHPMRSLLGDVARASHATALTLPPLSLDAVTELLGERSVDPRWLHQITAGNAFFVFEMLDHSGDDLPTSVRDSILSRAIGLDTDAWDLLHLLACAQGPIPEDLLVPLGIREPAIRTLWDSKFVRRSDRGLAFRHDLCRLAIASVIPPGAEVDLHRRLIAANDAASHTDPAVLTHHALGAGDRELIRRAASDAGRVAGRSGAHTQAAEFYEIALDRGDPSPAEEAQLRELLAEECYLTDRLDDALRARRRALHLREQSDDRAAAGANHHALAIYESHNADLSAAEHHAAQSVSALQSLGAQGGPEMALLGHALASQAYFAILGSDLTRAATVLSEAAELAARAEDPTLLLRVGLFDGYRGGLAGEDDARGKMLSSISSATDLFEDEICANGCTSLAFVDIEQRRLDQAAEVLDMSIALSVERDIPLGRSWFLSMRSRLHLLLGKWDDADADTEAVLNGPCTPLASTLPLVVRALVSLRRDGVRIGGIDEAWRTLSAFGAHLRLSTAAAIAEQAWLTGVHDERLDECRSLLDDFAADGLQMSTGELAVWLRRLDLSTDTALVAGPYRLLLDGAFEAASDEFRRMSMPYEAALALTESGDSALTRRGLDELDRLGAAAVASKVRGDLKASGLTVVPARRRSTTLNNPAGLTARQIEVLGLLDKGLTYAELAAQIHLSVKTVDKHVSAIISKLEAANRRDAVRRARELGILD